MNVKFWIGTMGFSYKDWSGPFYPPDVASRNYLSYYSRNFNAIEVDSTFYGIPKAETVQRWGMMTPGDFKFCLKTPRIITHDLGLVSAAWGLMNEFVQTVLPLKEKLGVILLQFPPSFTAEKLTDLEAFVRELPSGARYAVELRHRSWYIASIAGKLTNLLQQAGAGWAATEYPRVPAQIHPTTDFLYIRWIGQHGSYEHHDHERVDQTPELKEWWKRLQPRLGDLQNVYGFFNNDYAGYAPGTANRFKEIVGLPVEGAEPPQQMSLF